MALNKNITITQGITFIDTIQHLDNDKNPISLANTVVYGQIQKSAYSANVLAAFTATITNYGNSVIEYGMTSTIDRKSVV